MQSAKKTLPTITKTKSPPSHGSPGPVHAKPARPNGAPVTRGAAPGKAPSATTTTKAATPAPTVEGNGHTPPRTTPTQPQSQAAPTFVPSRVFAWPADAEASGYLVRFFRDGAKVYETRSTKPRLTLPKSFRFLPGSYRWEVLPILESAPNLRYGPPIVESTFVLTGG